MAKVFDAKRMKKLIAKDSYLKMMYKSLKAVNVKEKDEVILKILFYSNVAEASDFDHIY